MKNQIYALLAFMLISCSVTQSESKPVKEILKGTWEVVKVEFKGSDDDKTYLFDLADPLCFMGSEWVFGLSPESGKFIILNSNHCETSNNEIDWSLHEPGDGTFQLQFKFVDDKNGSMESSNRGYGIKVEQLNNTSMQMLIVASSNTDINPARLTLQKISQDVNL